MHQCKWIIITGGVLSGLGKGIVTASVGRLLTPKFKVVPLKCDGYLNVDPGTMNPIEHGEVFVLPDGGEVDMDFGHYERFLNKDCKFKWNLTSGKVFKHVIDKERKGEYLGKTVQMIPHVTDEIKRRFYEIAQEEKAQVMLIEVGGTVGDIENMLFIEACRQLRNEVGRENIMYIHITLVPTLSSVGEEKTKPTQQSISMLQQRGIQPDVIIGRAARKLTEPIKKKIALFSSLYEQEIISDPDTSSVYELPLIFEEEGLVEIICKKLNLHLFEPKIDKWKTLVSKIQKPKGEVNVLICGKYTQLHDSYASVTEALVHAGAHNDVRVNIKFLETTDVEKGKITPSEALKGVQGVIVPGGFGNRGVEGKIEVIKYCRENNIPYLGLCFGLQLATIEFARNCCDLIDANSTELGRTQHPVIDILPTQKDVTQKGATMRLGDYKAKLLKGSKVAALYNADVAFERHRHRYEVNPKYHDVLRKNGLILSGLSEDGTLAEFIELKDHPYFVGTQAHPELKSRLESPAPLFVGFIEACKKNIRVEKVILKA